MANETITDRAVLPLPYGRQATLKDVQFESGLEMLRMTLKEGNRFTIIDLDAASAQAIATELLAWADKKSLNPDKEK